jgi:hypothetical protein
MDPLRRCSKCRGEHQMKHGKKLMRDEVKGELFLRLTKHNDIIPYILNHGTR